MTEIFVSKRDGVARAPDGTQYRVHRGKTLADGRHPVVVAYPGDWMPMEVHLSVPGESEPAAPTPDAEVFATLEELRNELAGVEELAEARGTELQRLADGLAGAGVELPAEDAREAGWLVDITLDAVTALQAPTAGPVDRTDVEPEDLAMPMQPVAPPRAPKARRPAVPRDGA